MNLSQSIKTCIKNGDRLIDDAGYLFDTERYTSAYALAKLAQEEYAKCFILKLVECGALKWTKEVRRSLNHHVSKQLMVVILEYLNPNTDDFLKMIEDKTWHKRPKKVLDAINIYVHEILRRWESSNWFWVENPKYDKEAKSIFDGAMDNEKQKSLYVKIMKDGRAIDTTMKFTKIVTEKEIEIAKRCGQFISSKDDDFRYKEIVEVFKVLKN